MTLWAVFSAYLDGDYYARFDLVRVHLTQPPDLPVHTRDSFGVTLRWGEPPFVFVEKIESEQ